MFCGEMNLTKFQSLTQILVGIPQNLFWKLLWGRTVISPFCSQITGDETKPESDKVKGKGKIDPVNNSV